MKKVKDHYYQKAKKDGFVARSVYKLEEIDRKEKLLKAKMKVMDLGCHPGSWTQYASKKVGAEGMVIGIDIQKVYQKFSKNVQIFQEDIYHLKLSNLPLTEFDFIISDIAPKTTGIRTLDAQRSFQLGEQVLSVAKETLKVRGNLLLKVFQGRDFEQLRQHFREQFQKVKIHKPNSSRSESVEIFLLGIHKKES